MKKIRLLAIFTTIFGLSSGAFAHAGVGATTGFMHGFLHPMFGLDHVLAMIAVGLWAVQLSSHSKRALWIVPISFVLMMVLGSILGMAGVVVPFVEQGILASVLILGVMVMTGVKLPTLAGVAIVGLFAIFHGHAHGAEMPLNSSGLMYGFGFVIATSLLHVLGIAVGKLRFSSLALRLAGAAVMLGGVYLMFA